MQQKWHLPFKRISATILLLLFIYNAIFSHVCLWLWKAYMNEQIEELARQLPNEALDEIQLPFTGTIESEIAVGGELFDVIRYKQSGNTIHYFCVKDFTENIICKAQTDDNIASKSLIAKNKWKDHAHQLHKNAAAKYILNAAVTFLCPTPHVHFFGINEVSTLAVFLAKNTPPPNRTLS